MTRRRRGPRLLRMPVGLSVKVAGKAPFKTDFGASLIRVGDCRRRDSRVLGKGLLRVMTS